MSYIVVIREYNYRDTPAINDLVRKAYLSNVFNSWCNALFKEVSFYFFRYYFREYITHLCFRSLFNSLLYQWP